MALALVGLCMLIVGVLVYDDARSLRTCGIRVCSIPPLAWGVLVAALPVFGVVYLARRPHAVRVGQRPRRRARAALDPPNRPAPSRVAMSSRTATPEPPTEPLAVIRWSHLDHAVEIPAHTRDHTGAGVG